MELRSKMRNFLYMSKNISGNEDDTRRSVSHRSPWWSLIYNRIIVASLLVQGIKIFLFSQRNEQTKKNNSGKNEYVLPDAT